MTTRSLKVIVKLQRRRDGGLRAWSDDVPGLVLSGDDPELVLADIGPALQVILSDMLGCEVQTSLLVPEQNMLIHPSSGRVNNNRFGAWLGRAATMEYAAAPCAA